jgi:hypothetical protein
MSTACKFCDDTGSLSKDLYGSLDCAMCDVADQRARLNAQLSTLDLTGEVRDWAIFKAGIEVGKMLNAAPNV